MKTKRKRDGEKSTVSTLKARYRKSGIVTFVYGKESSERKAKSFIVIESNTCL